MKGRYLATIAATAAATLWGSSALAAVVSCPNPAIAGFNYMTLDTTLTVSCYDYGTSTDNTGNPTVSNSGAPVVLDDKILQLPAGTSLTDNFGSYLSGVNNAGLTGTFTVTNSANGPLYLLFKVGSGPAGNLWWYTFLLDGLVKDATIKWTIIDVSGGQQALSHTELFGGTPVSSSSSSSGGDTSTSSSSSSSGTNVPEPASSLVLLGLGLLGLGFMRRRAHSA